MCEVENRKVLQDLLFKTYLLRYDYGIIHEDSPDQRGIDVCLIYRRDAVELLYYRYLIPAGLRVEDFHTRSVLYARMKVYSDTMDLIVNHWPSRRGGALAGEDMRKSIAGMVGEVCDTISGSSSGKAKILICGDFNSTPDDIEIRTLVNSRISGSSLVNLSENKAVHGEGSYRYKGIWEMIDQVIISESFLDSVSGLYTSMDHLKIFRPDFLLENDPVYPGLSPFSTYRGYRYHGGYSDHLPVIIDLIIKDP
jgi:predicted extracellular nuclease